MSKPVLLLALAAALVAAASPVLAERPTARASGIQAVHSRPSASSPTIDRLANNERVYLDFCTRQARWCHVIQLDGGPAGWVLGSYLVGSPAKNAVTPFEFSFNPLDPLDLFKRHR